MCCDLRRIGKRFVSMKKSQKPGNDMATTILVAVVWWLVAWWKKGFVW